MKPPQVLGVSLLTAFWAFWARHQPPVAAPHVFSLALSDNVQTPMNLVMPLNYPRVAYEGLFAQTLFNAADEILSGLNNVGTLHFARFDIIDGNLCMLSIYDGDFNGYIRDFIGTIGEAFDAIMRFVKDPPPTPCGQYVDEFIAWVGQHDALRLPEDLPTDVTKDLRDLNRKTLVELDIHRNAQMGIYRGYPGYSVAQIRNGLGIGW